MLEKKIWKIKSERLKKYMRIETREDRYVIEMKRTGRDTWNRNRNDEETDTNRRNGTT
jgi:hypothetical protein